MHLIATTSTIVPHRCAGDKAGKEVCCFEQGSWLGIVIEFVRCDFEYARLSDSVVRPECDEWDGDGLEARKGTLLD